MLSLRSIFMSFCSFFFFYLTSFSFFFFFNDTATTEIYTLSLHDALPISVIFKNRPRWFSFRSRKKIFRSKAIFSEAIGRSEEHTSELQSQSNLVCRLLLEKKKKKKKKKKNKKNKKI